MKMVKAKGVLYTDTRTGEEFEQPADVVCNDQAIHLIMFVYYYYQKLGNLIIRKRVKESLVKTFAITT